MVSFASKVVLDEFLWMDFCRWISVDEFLWMGFCRWVSVDGFLQMESMFLLLLNSKFFTKDFSKERSNEYKYLWTSLRKDQYEKRQVKTRELDRSHLSASPMGEDDHHRGHLARGRGRPAPRSPPPWARTTSTTVTSPMDVDDLAHGRGQPSPRSPRQWARTTITKVTSPMGEDDQHHGHLAHGRGRFAPGSPRPRARTIQSRSVRLVSTLVSSV
ncbi:hypothetical protein F2Q68_00044333 [Brassica cretica]|uniref:Uncharacterized protein n=1 Tax=Brassica cretica TaxID=69181 RepID=A0A8S9LN04_BRACR|nr:hypothetical protein F2Q68_00044333 [Brassica cretica]